MRTLLQWLKKRNIEYAGVAGISRECLLAVMRLLQFGSIKKAKILSSSGSHCLLLTSLADDLIAIKSGFGSGYAGEGPDTFSYVLLLLDTFDIPIDEFEVSRGLLKRIDSNSFTDVDVEQIQNSNPISTLEAICFGQTLCDATRLAAAAQLSQATTATSASDLDSGAG
jgi:hypothetical protein